MKYLQLLAVALIVLGCTLTVTITGAEPPAISSAVAPVYPTAARAARIKGDVSVDITVDQNGKVRSATAVNGHALLKKAAEDAARQWTFAPALRGPTERPARLDFSFVITDDSEVTSVFYPWYYKIEVRASPASH